MADVHNSKIRSYNMSQIKSKNTKPEILVRKFLFSKGLRYRLNDKKLSGKPDLVFKKLQTVVFIHGCFWHGHENCKLYSIPKTRTEFWVNKIETNKQRDKRNIKKLKREGWRVLVIYECKLHTKIREKSLDKLLARLSDPVK